MKKYFILGIVVVAVVAVWLSWSQGQMAPDGGGGDLPAFYGTAKYGRMVTACKKPDMFPCRSTNATSENWYILRLPKDLDWYGTYIVDDGTGCTPQEGVWAPPPWPGVRIDFCTGEPSECPCY
jgi:hypothetical protein